MDSTGDKIPVSDYTKNETRFRIVEKIDPQGFRLYGQEAQYGAKCRMSVYKYLSGLHLPPEDIDTGSGTDKKS